MMRSLLRISLLVAFLATGLFPLAGQAAAGPDTDGDGLLDGWEERVFQTDPRRADTDSDGFPDATEVRYGFDPRDPAQGARLAQRDADGDGLADALEVAFGSDPLQNDSDQDGYADGIEITHGYNPNASTTKPLAKRLRVDLSEQTLAQELDGVVIATYPVSSGKAATPTPLGTFKIETKSPRAWSNRAKLWMPYWMGFRGWLYGVHELPEWPNGKKEGKAHLGIPVSHGCVRVAEGVSKQLYDWAPIGTEVIIQR